MKKSSLPVYHFLIKNSLYPFIVYFRPKSRLIQPLKLKITPRAFGHSSELAMSK